MTSATVDVLFGRVQAGATWTEQNGRNAGMAEHRGVRPETGADDRAACGSRATATAASICGSSCAAGTSYAGRLNIAEALARNVAILACQRRQNVAHFVQRGGFRFARQRPPLHLQTRPVGVATELAAAFDERRVQRTGAHQRMRRPRLNRGVERFEAGEHAAEAQDGILPFRRPAAMRSLP